MTAPLKASHALQHWHRRRLWPAWGRRHDQAETSTWP